MRYLCSKCLPEEEVELELVTSPTKEFPGWQFHCPKGNNPQNSHNDLFGMEGVVIDHKEGIKVEDDYKFKQQAEVKRKLAEGSSTVGWDFNEPDKGWQESEASRKAKEQIEYEKKARERKNE